MLNKKTISPVVATALLLVVAVVAVTGFQVFFNTYSSGLFSKAETQSSSQVGNTQIEDLIGNSLYFRNSNTENITINQIKIDEFDCNISQNISTGITELDVSSCVSNLTISTPEVVVYTTKGIYSEKYFINNLATQSSEFLNATGGTITYFGNYKIHNFTTNGTFNVISGSGTVEYLVVAGGGGGGGRLGGGGGGGGVLNDTLLVSVGSKTVVVGSGGVGSANIGLNGSNSVFDTITAIGGGGGGTYFGSGGWNGSLGGSGGGGAGGSNLALGGNGTSGQGYAGGLGHRSAATWGSGAGGGGASQIGFGGTGEGGNTAIGGAGGLGINSSITGINITYAGGGGGSVEAGGSGPVGAGGLGGGGAGGLGAVGVNGISNTGGGGGGG